MPQENVVEIKPINRYSTKVKTQTPSPPPSEKSEGKKTVEYYVPIIQDIDENVPYNTGKKSFVS